MEGASPDKTKETYQSHAEAYDRQRSRKFFEARWLARFGDVLPRGSKVLDLGCGGGQPVSAWLIAEGFSFTGVDYSEAMLDIARRRWPSENWCLADMRSLDLNETFHGIVAWDSFFHLTQQEQRDALPRLAAHLEPGGLLLVTVGPKAGESVGQVAGEPVLQASLSPAEYASLLELHGLMLIEFVSEDPQCGFHTVLMAKKLHVSDLINERIARLLT